MRKSNPPLLEWLRSPIVYRDIPEKTELFRSLIPECYAPRNCYYHCYNMGKGNCREYIKGDTVWLKKYFYVLRPILGCRWIETHDEPVPMEFAKLLEETVDDNELTDAVEKLLEEKKAVNLIKALLFP